MIFFVSPGADPNRPDLLFGLANQPLVTITRFLQLALQDFVFNLAGAWYETMQPAAIDLTDRVFLVSLVVALVSGLLVFTYLIRQYSSANNDPSESQNNVQRRCWIRQLLLIGLLASFLGPLPVWLTERNVLWGMWGGRFGKADLAHQLEDWAEVMSLGDEAEEQGLHPGDANEWIPFIQGYAVMGEWDKAINRTLEAYQMKSEIAPRLCWLWKNLQSSTSTPAEVITTLQKYLSCDD